MGIALQGIRYHVDILYCIGPVQFKLCRPSATSGQRELPRDWACINYPVKIPCCNLNREAFSR